MQKVNQANYKLKKEKAVPVVKIDPKLSEKQVTGQDVMNYLADKVFAHRGFILLTALILSWTFFLVRS